MKTGASNSAELYKTWIANEPKHDETITPYTEPTNEHTDRPEKGPTELLQDLSNLFGEEADQITDNEFVAEKLRIIGGSEIKIHQKNIPSLL